MGMELELDSFEFPFPFSPADELFPLPPLSPLDHHLNIPIPIPIPIPHQPPFITTSKHNKTNLTSQKPKNGRRKKPAANTSVDHHDNVDAVVVEDENPNEQKKKKIIHRDVERQRRQEMSALYSSLRSLIPHEYLKGKRSICDQMHETLKFIQHKQMEIEKLRKKRDELKMRHNVGDSTAVETLESSKRDSVVVNPTSGGFRVLLDTATQHRLPLSNLLKCLLQERLEIVSCFSTKRNDRFLHTVFVSQLLAPVGVSSIDVLQLQHKLANLQYFPLD